MKHIINFLKTEIYKQFSNIDGLVKKVTISQESFLKERSNEALFNIWSENVKNLNTVESNLHTLHSAYATICSGCGIEPMSVEDIVAEKNSKAEKKALRKSKSKKEIANKES